jgi:hypothetical protein
MKTFGQIIHAVKESLGAAKDGIVTAGYTAKADYMEAEIKANSGSRKVRQDRMAASKKRAEELGQKAASLKASRKA